jgi:hypothetical protein
MKLYYYLYFNQNNILQQIDYRHKYRNLLMLHIKEIYKNFLKEQKPMLIDLCLESMTLIFLAHSRKNQLHFMAYC